MCAKVFPAVPTQSAPFEKTDPYSDTSVYRRRAAERRGGGGRRRVGVCCARRVRRLPAPCLLTTSGRLFGGAASQLANPHLETKKEPPHKSRICDFTAQRLGNQGFLDGANEFEARQTPI